jgi:hypothetical protein
VYRSSVLLQGQGTFRAAERFPRMNKMTTDLRAAAASARAFADSAGSAELKQSFYAMAQRWEAEADRCEKKGRRLGNFRMPARFSARGTGRKPAPSGTSDPARRMETLMANVANISEHMEVLSSDGKHVGTVDHMEGEDKIKLTRSDIEAQDGHHHFIPMDWVSDVGNTVRLDKTQDEVFSQWEHE